MPPRYTIKTRVEGKKVKVYASKIVTNGRTQNAFKNGLGKEVGACVAAKVKKGMSSREIQEIVKGCAYNVKGRSLYNEH